MSWGSRSAILDLPTCRVPGMIIGLRRIPCSPCAYSAVHRSAWAGNQVLGSPVGRAM